VLSQFSLCQWQQHNFSNLIHEKSKQTGLELQQGAACINISANLDFLSQLNYQDEKSANQGRER
jgi:hypothetical protein